MQLYLSKMRDIPVLLYLSERVLDIVSKFMTNEQLAAFRSKIEDAVERELNARLTYEEALEHFADDITTYSAESEVVMQGNNINGVHEYAGILGDTPNSTDSAAKNADNARVIAGAYLYKSLVGATPELGDISKVIASRGAMHAYFMVNGTILTPDHTDYDILESMDTSEYEL